MLNWAVWFMYLFNKVIAKNYFFTVISFSKQSTFWKELEICESWALFTDLQKTYVVNTLVEAAIVLTGGF